MKPFAASSKAVDLFVDRTRYGPKPSWVGHVGRQTARRLAAAMMRNG
jgi:hypothetical protein